MERPAYFGNLPYPPKSKKPCVIRDADQKKDFFSHEVPEESNVYTVIASTDKLHCGMMAMAPGSTWRFVDEHLGDECYYLLQGNLTELECDSGECVEANAGDTLFIPMGCKHKGYNFSEEKQILFWSIAPKMWPEKTDTSYPAEKIRFYKHGRDEFGLKGMPEKDVGLRKEFKLRQRDVNQLGTFPLPGPEARQKPIHYYVQNRSNCITTVFGAKFPMRLRFHVSNDYMHVGEMYLPCGGVGARTSEVDSHEGDTVILVTRGQITFFMPETEEVHFAKTGEVMYIPERTKYQLINYDATPVEAYFAIGGGL
jgi:mannose-6-phosphate isomerase-like protein (cupin superfamily)